ncbi:MAG: polymorphic toxin-type HINT domain-containing protein [Thermogemmata sp.]
MAAGELKPGDRIVGLDLHESVAVTALRLTGRQEKLYNLRVADYHTYFVGDSTWGFALWAHNEYNAPTNSPVPRLGSRGVDPAHHNANIMVRDASGRLRHHERIVSGNMTPEEQALGFPRNTLASHTEARAIRNIPLQRGETTIITGQRPPCPTCKGIMNQAARESGATIIYRWRENGVTRT